LRLDERQDPGDHTVMGDAGRLQQVFANLLSNAIKFTAAGGQITISLARVRGEAEVTVTDSGAGIAPELLPHVFDRFHQAGSSNVRRYGGLGLGLSVVAQVVRMHAGRVQAHSAGPGAGATFTVTLPLHQPSDAAVVPSTTEPTAPGGTLPLAPLRGLSILVIEDDSDSRELLSVLLENAGAVPVAAETVAEALRLLGDLQIDVVLSDIGMPDQDGFDLIRQLRQFPNARVRRAPAIAVTAFARSEDLARIMAAGFDAHIGKPVEPVDLLRIIGEVHARRRASGATDDGRSSEDESRVE